MTLSLKWIDPLPSQPPENFSGSVNRNFVAFDFAHGGRLARWNYGEHELIGAFGSDPVEHGFYIMAPWAGRLSNNSLTWAGQSMEFPCNYGEFALHGFALNTPPDSVFIEQSADLITVVTTHHIKGWLGSLVIEASWHIHAESLITTLRATTSSSEPVPVLMGWHPWFRNQLGEGQTLSVDFSQAEIAVREGSLPTGQLVHVTNSDGPFDDAFRIPNKTVNLRWGNDLALRVTSSHEWFVVFNQLKDFTCVEPQNGPPNVFEHSMGCQTYTTTQDDPLELRAEWSFI